MDLTDQLRTLKAAGVVCAELYEGGQLKSVQFVEQFDPIKELARRAAPERPEKDDLRDNVLGKGPPDVEFDPSELPKLPKAA